MSLLHVLYRDYLNGGWAVLRDGKQRATYFFDEREDAIARAKEIARAENGELWVHDEANEKKIVEKLDFRKPEKKIDKKKKKG